MESHRGNGRSGPTVPVISNAGIYQQYQTLAHLTLKAIINDPKLEVVAIATSTRALFQLDNDYSIEKLPASPNKQSALEGLDTMVSEIIKAGKKVVLVVDNPTLPDPKKCVPRRPLWPHWICYSGSPSKCPAPSAMKNIWSCRPLTEICSTPSRDGILAQYGYSTHSTYCAIPPRIFADRWPTGDWYTDLQIIFLLIQASELQRN